MSGAQSFTLDEDGDAVEQRHWATWASRFFPAYEGFWIERIVPLSGRAVSRRDIRLRSDPELPDGFAPEDVAVAQLHYTLIVHLGRVWDLAFDGQESFGEPQLVEAFTRLAAASDVSDELLQRRLNPSTYDAWDERSGARARLDWRKANLDPLQPIRRFRNRLVHGRVVPSLRASVHDAEGNHLRDRLMVPSVESVDRHLDWRPSLEAVARAEFPPGFEEADAITREAWGRVVWHVNLMWRTRLLEDFEGLSSCGNCERWTDDPDRDGWRALSDGVGGLPLFCRDCWEREFAAKWP